MEEQNLTFISGHPNKRNRLPLQGLRHCHLAINSSEERQGKGQRGKENKRGRENNGH